MSLETQRGYNNTVGVWLCFVEYALIPGPKCLCFADEMKSAIIAYVKAVHPPSRKENSRRSWERQSSEGMTEWSN